VRDVLQNVGPVAAAQAVISYLAAQVPFRAPPRTMEDAFVRQFGRRLYEMFFENYSEKVWGRPCSELSADWVGQRTKGLSVLSAVQGALCRGARKVESLVEEFYYPRTGYGRISERMAERLTAHGGALALRTRVVGIVTGDGRVIGVRIQSGTEASRVLSADAVISTVPLPLCVRLLETTVPQDVRDAAAGLRFRDLITVAVFLDRERVGDDTWLYVHDPDIPFARIHEPRNWSSAMAPAGKTSLVAEYFVDRGDAISGKSESELYETTVDHLSRGLDLIRREEVQGCYVFRARNAYPIYGLDYGSRLHEVKEYLSGFSNLQLVGRGGAFRYDNSDHSIEMGIAAAKNLLGDRQDLDQVNSADEYLEERRLSCPSGLTPGKSVTGRPLA
jgi:protoporphyrinogen oxidase